MNFHWFCFNSIVFFIDFNWVSVIYIHLHWFGMHWNCFYSLLFIYLLIDSHAFAYVGPIWKNKIVQGRGGKHKNWFLIVFHFVISNNYLWKIHPGHSFPIWATQHIRPLIDLKSKADCLNNCLGPIVFIVLYCICIGIHGVESYFVPVAMCWIVWACATIWAWIELAPGSCFLSLGLCYSVSLVQGLGKHKFNKFNAMQHNT